MEKRCSIVEWFCFCNLNDKQKSKKTLKHKLIRPSFLHVIEISSIQVLKIYATFSAPEEPVMLFPFSLHLAWLLSSVSTYGLFYYCKVPTIITLNWQIHAEEIYSKLLTRLCFGIKSTNWVQIIYIEKYEMNILIGIGSGSKILMHS